MKLDGNFFEDLDPGQRLINPVPRTLTEGDVALYIALTGDRNPKNCSDEFARALGDDNMVPLLIEAVEQYVTLGEICRSLRGVRGEQREATAL